MLRQRTVIFLTEPSLFTDETLSFWMVQPLRLPTLCSDYAEYHNSDKGADGGLAYRCQGPTSRIMPRSDRSGFSCLQYNGRLGSRKSSPCCSTTVLRTFSRPFKSLAGQDSLSASQGSVDSCDSKFAAEGIPSSIPANGLGNLSALLQNTPSPFEGRRWQSFRSIMVANKLFRMPMDLRTAVGSVESLRAAGPLHRHGV